MTTLKERMKQVRGVIDASYNFGAMSLAVYYEGTSDLERIKIQVADKIDGAMLHSSINTVNYYSTEVKPVEP